LIAALEAQHTTVALVLLEAGADSTASNRRGDSALKIAAETGSLEVVEKLIELEAHRVAEAGDRALRAVLLKLDKLARRSGEATGGGEAPGGIADPDTGPPVPRHREVVRVLVLAGASLDWKTESGQEARSLAERLGLAELLQRSGLDR
jgi:hypothetical protein